MIKAPIVEDSSGNVVAGPSSWGGGPPGGGGNELEQRVNKLEAAAQEIRDKLVRVEMRLDNIESGMATKLDVAILASKDDVSEYVRASGKDIQELAVAFQKSINDQTWKFVAVATGLATLAFTAAKFIH
ncbi:hypothetical protein PS689_05441 [Pseudomonas fluorescens]|nr:hypothetical protein PS689_05441 [Pseudomonas fluorescens]